MVNTSLHRFALPAVSVLLSACGSTSEMKPVGTYSGKKYSGAVVALASAADAKTDLSDHKLGFAMEDLTRQIAAEIARKSPQAKVVRAGRPGPDDLVVETRITEYIEGNAMARLLIGMGAGNSNIEGDVLAKDGKTGTVLGQVKIDKYGWILGGGLASTQTPETFHKEIAKRVAEGAAPMLR